MTELSHLDDYDPPELGRSFLDQVHRRTRSLARRRRVARSAAAGLFVAVAAVGVGAALVRPDTIDVVTPGDGVDEIVTVLIAGTDGCGAAPCPAQVQASDAGYADALMVVRLRPSTGSVEAVSIPRDLWIPPSELGGVDGRKVNALDITERLRFLEQRFDLGVDHYIEIDRPGFVALVDAVGGVELHLARPVSDQGSGLRIDRAGCQSFDGGRLLALVRSRHLVFEDGSTDPTGDLGRVRRQQQVLVAALRSASDSPDLSSRIPELARILTEHARVDPSLDLPTLVRLGSDLLRADTLDVRVATLPVEPGGDEGRAWFTSPATDLWAGLESPASRPIGDLVVPCTSDTCVPLHEASQTFRMTDGPTPAGQSSVEDRLGRLVRSDRFRSELAARLAADPSFDEPATELESRIVVNSGSNAPVLTLTVGIRDEDAQRAAALAIGIPEAVTRAFQAVERDLPIEERIPGPFLAGDPASPFLSQTTC